MRNSLEYARELAALPELSHAELVARVRTFMESYGDHDEDCPLIDSSLYGRDAELGQCVCGYCFRWELLAELERRLGS
jgi:hypothetical protein